MHAGLEIDNTVPKRIIAVLGGTGDLGPGLAARWALAGHRVLIGSREAGRAERAAAELRESLSSRATAPLALEGSVNEAAAAAADIALLTVPFAHQEAVLSPLSAALDGKILIDSSVPLRPPKVGRVQLPSEGAAALIAQRILGAGVRVVSAFQNVAAHHLQSESAVLDCDVLVSGDDPAAREEVIALVRDAGLRGLHAGPLANAAAAEALTSVLIQLNRRHSCHAGLRITGLSPTA